MPYWTSSRVGPIVVDIHKKKKKDAASNNNNNNKNPSASTAHRRGITMEDLKKQTALRLAQEQSSVVVVGDGNGNVPGKNTHNNPSEESITSTSYHTASTAPTTLSDGGPEDVATTTAPAVESPPPGPPPTSSASSSGHRLFRSSPITKQPRSCVAQVPENHPDAEKKYATPTKSSSGGGFFFSRSTPLAPASAPTMKHPPASRSLFFTSTSSGRHQNINAASMNSISSVVIASRTAIDTSTATEKGTNAKLPHGLTVSELKQMTKARLQAEATHSHHEGSPALTMMMMDTGSVHGVTNEAMYPTVAAPPSRRSPYPMVYDTTSDTWETASVSTTCTSEFLFPTTGAAANNESVEIDPNLVHDDAAIPFVRTLSYPNSGNTHPKQPVVSAGMASHQNNLHYGTAMYHHPPQPSNMNSSNPYHNSSTLQHAPYSNVSTSNTNRCRAATSSPRLGISSTSAVHYPTYNAGDGYPFHHTFSTTQNNHTNSAMSNHETLPFSDEYMTPSTIFSDQRSDDGGFYPNGLGSTPFSYESNRCRTSSLPSVLLPTAVDGDDPTRNRMNFGNISRHPVNHLSAVNEQTQFDKTKVFVAGLSDAFQSSQVSSFPDFYSANHGNINDSFTLDDGFGMTGIGHNDPLPPVRYRASTWADATSTTSKSNSTSTAASSLLLFGNVGSGTATEHGRACTTDLSDDLASILKLSTVSSLSSQQMGDENDGISSSAATHSTTDGLSTSLF